MYLPGALHKAARAFVREPKSSIIYGDYIKVDENDRCIALRRQPSFSYNICLFSYLTVMQPAAFFRRDVVFDVGLLDASFHFVMDYDLIVRIAKQGKVIHLPEYLAAFRLHAKSKSMTLKSLFKEECQRMRIERVDYRPLPMELSLRSWYYKIHVVLRMVSEGCLPSRFGRDKGEYKLNEIYTPRMLEF
jgi:GT2 family glycosyltransferase